MEDVYVVERTHPWAEDLDWIPRNARILRWMVSGSIWAGTGILISALAAVAPPVAFGLWKLLAFGGIGAAVAGERVGAAVYRRQVAKLARGEVDLAALRDREEGEIVRVRGKIQASDTLTGVLHETPGVFRRLVFEPTSGRRWVHEAAVDFTLVDASGQRIFVRAGGARLLVATEELLDYPVARFQTNVSPRVTDLIGGATTVRARERVLLDGAEVEIVGVKTLTPDPEGASAGYREPPQRATLKASRELPLLITPLP